MKCIIENDKLIVHDKIVLTKEEFLNSYNAWIEDGKTNFTKDEFMMCYNTWVGEPDVEVR